MSSDKPPPKRAWDTLTRHMRRKASGADPPPETAQAPPPAAQPPPAPPPPEAPESKLPDEAKKALESAFAPAPDEKDKGGAASPLPSWKKERFQLTREQAALAADPKVQLARMMDHARNRPLLSTVVLLGAIAILVGDAMLIARRFGLDDWLMINFDIGKDPSRTLEMWERRGTGLALVSGPPGQEKEVVDATQASAVDGTLKLPGKPLESPRLAGGLAGILTPEEVRSGFKADSIGGLDSAVLAGGAGAGAVGNAFVKTEKDDFKPYMPAGTRSHLEPTPTGVFFGAAGDALENFASLSHGAPDKAPGYGGPDYSAIQEVPQGLNGDELVLAMIGDDLKKDLKAYAKGGHWKLRKMEKGEKTVRHELEGMSLTGNNAVIQLLQTKRATDSGLKCATCQTERRIHNTRAPFFGEEH